MMREYDNGKHNTTYSARASSKPRHGETTCVAYCIGTIASQYLVVVEFGCTRATNYEA
jgi:hypothetical protein